MYPLEKQENGGHILSVEEWPALGEYRILRSKDNVPNIFSMIMRMPVKLKYDYIYSKDFSKRNKQTN